MFKKSVKWEWEEQWEYVEDSTQRLRVVGVWLVRTYFSTGGAMVFVPDPEHVWKVEMVKVE